MALLAGKRPQSHRRSTTVQDTLGQRGNLVGYAVPGHIGFLFLPSAALLYLKPKPKPSCPTLHFSSRPLNNVDVVAEAVGSEMLQEHGFVAVIMSTPDTLPVSIKPLSLPCLVCSGGSRYYLARTHQFCKGTQIQLFWFRGSMRVTQQSRHTPSHVLHTL